MSISKRLLGLAFAAADLLLEIDPGGRIVFALGCSPITGAAADALVGQSLFDRVGKVSAGAIQAVLSDLAPGARSMAIEVLFLAEEGKVRRATSRLFVMPDLAPNVSVSVTWEGPAYPLHDPEARPALTPAAFLDRARSVLTTPGASQDLAVAFVDVLGLEAAQGLGEAGERLRGRVEAALQAASIDGASAAKLSPERFTLLRNRATKTDLEGEMRELGLSEGLDLGLRSSEVLLDPATDPLHTLRALRFALEGCLKTGILEEPERTFTATLARTLKEASAFRTMVRERNFELNYQPIVDLKSGAIHHFEALSRFSGTRGPAETIHMAEELALIDAFDVAVAEKALERLRRPDGASFTFAVNVSGASLADDRYVGALLRMTAGNPRDRQRLIVEVTESAALADVDAASRRLGALRAAGIRVCIDDFGAGSACYDYLRGLSVDTVKIDGRFVDGLEKDPKARTLITHLVDLCASLKVDTIAERIETRPAADILRDLRVDYGQGWLFGRPESEPRIETPAVKPARRVGAVVGWS
ncbi:MAG: EAL domain-containing protein [Brevundimonas sp.]|uniref:sensor domain-containing phosphodiesterase n=1 Tax=Brevundimonas sp. TaxID=1871086 RepID=UPI002735AEF6|nr:EAL domain-containing protein [Brevundimonas sp.]MDP3405511.1 EAL domain-containing protein [Brevundimonas sp.]